MSSGFISTLPSLVVPNGATESNAMGFPSYHDAASITLYGPSSITGGGTQTIQVSIDGSNWNDLQDSSGDVAAPGANKALSYTEVLAALYFRIKCSSAVTGATTWKASKLWTA